MSTSSSDGTVVTLWFVSTPNPAEVIAQELRSDRGFGRKYLAQLNPAWPITPIGQFPLNRSAPASTDEFYISGFPGVSLVQTVVPRIHQLSQLDPALLRSLPAADVYVFATESDSDFGGIAHFHDGVVVRSLCAHRDRVYEDIGLPDPFERPFWAGEHDDNAGTSIDLPFHPIDLIPAAYRAWLGFELTADGPDVHISAFAVDGRPEPKVSDPYRRTSTSLNAVVGRASSKLGLSVRDPEYDDYERHGGEDTGYGMEELRRLAETGLAIATTIGGLLGAGGRTIGHSLKRRWGK